MEACHIFTYHVEHRIMMVLCCCNRFRRWNLKGILYLFIHLFLFFFTAQPGRSLVKGYSWPGVFLPGASGRTGRFFTQLLFHNPSVKFRFQRQVWIDALYIFFEMLFCNRIMLLLDKFCKKQKKECQNDNKRPSSLFELYCHSCLLFEYREV